MVSETSPLSSLLTAPIPATWSLHKQMNLIQPNYYKAWYNNNCYLISSLHIYFLLVLTEAWLWNLSNKIKVYKCKEHTYTLIRYNCCYKLIIMWLQRLHLESHGNTIKNWHGNSVTTMMVLICIFMGQQYHVIVPYYYKMKFHV